MSGGKKTARFATFSYIRRYSIDYNRQQLITEISEQKNNREKLSSQNKNKQQSGNPAIQKTIYTTTSRTPDERRRQHAPCEGDQVRTAQAKRKNMTALVKIKSMLPATARAKGRYSTNQNEIECVREKEKHHSKFVIISKRGGGRAM
jgi:hypothetical protein